VFRSLDRARHSPEAAPSPRLNGYGSPDYTGLMQFEVPSALEYFSSLVADDASFSLTEVALSLAQDEFPDLDMQETLAEIDALCERLRRRLAADAPPVQ